MFLIPDGERTYGLKPMNCPGHMLIFGNRLRSYRELPLRYAEAGTLHRNELAGTLHGLTRVRHVTQDDSHLFCTRDQIEDEIFGCLDFTVYLYELFGSRVPVRALDPAGEQARDRRGVGLHRRRAASSARAARARVRAQRGRRRVLRAEDRPAHDRLARPFLADGHGPARLADAAAVRPHLRRARQPRAHPVRHPSRELRLARAVHRDPDRALRRRVPVLARAGAGAGDPGRREPSRRGRRARRAGSSRYRVEVDESDDTVGKRIRNAEVDKIPFVVVFGDKESDEALAIREHGGAQETLSLQEFQAKLATLSPWQAGADPSLTS